jgi:peptidoglycan/LPS O-acetylase OafA/YrhL
MTPSIAPEKTELKSLTSLRGLAAMAVVLQHFSATAQEHANVVIPSLVPHGYVAVDFFFVLSGFIMAYTYLHSFQAQGIHAYRPFLVKRVARVVPLNVAVLAVIVIVGLALEATIGRNLLFDDNNFGFNLAANLLMLQGIGIGRNLNGPSWSISVEFAAYFMFPVFVALMFHSRMLARITTALAIVGIVAIASVNPRLAMTIEAPPGSVLRCFFEFTLGLAAYRLFTSPRAAAMLGRDDVTIGLTLAACASLVARLDLPAVLLFPFIVVAYAVNRGLPARIMRLGLFHFLGVISFSLYLLHNPFRPIELLLLQTLAPAPVGAVAALTFAFVGACSVIPFAWLAYRIVERPSRTLLRRLFGDVPTAIKAAQ